MRWGTRLLGAGLVWLALLGGAQAAAAGSALPSPIVKTVAAGSIDNQGAVLSGTINPQSQQVTYQFLYGTSATALTQSTPVSTGPTGRVATTETATLAGLAPSTTYYFQLQASAAGRSYSGAVKSFTTSAPPQIPVAETGSASAVTPDGAQLAGNVDPGGPQPVRYSFSYGTSAANLDQATPAATAPGGLTPVPVSTSIAGLAADVTYYFRLDVSFQGHTYSGQVQSFTTPIPAPTAATAAPTWVTNTSAIASGLVGPAGFDTTYQFEFGATTAYGQLSPILAAGAGDSEAPVSASFSGLLPGTVYHYRLVATSAGGTTVGSDQTFTTGTALMLPPQFSLRIRRRVLLSDALGSKLQVQFSCSSACLAHFDVVAAPGSGGGGLAAWVTLGQAAGSLTSAGSGSATLVFPAVVRNGLRHRKPLELIVTGYAVGAGTSASAPAIAPFAITPQPAPSPTAACRRGARSTAACRRGAGAHGPRRAPARSAA